MGCNGGFPTGAWHFFKKHGITTEEKYPYAFPPCEVTLNTRNPTLRNLHAVDSLSKNGLLRLPSAQATCISACPVSNFDADSMQHHTNGSHYKPCGASKPTPKCDRALEAKPR